MIKNEICKTIAETTIAPTNLLQKSKPLIDLFSQMILVGSGAALNFGLSPRILCSYGRCLLSLSAKL